MEWDLENMKQVVSAEAPAGENQEYDPLYMGLEELVAGIPASQMGDSIVEGKDPDYRKLQKNVLALWETTRDLRLAVYLAVSGVALDGLKGFADALELIHSLIENLWTEFYPQLDPDDDNDPLERLNILGMISPPPGAFDDPVNFLNLVRNVRLSPVGAAYTLRDLMLAEGELESSDETPDLSLLNAEMAGVPVSVMLEQGELVNRIADLLQQIGNEFESKSGGYSVSFATLNNELKRLQHFYSKYSSRQELEENKTAVETAVETVGAVGTVQAPAAGFADIQSVKARNRSEALLLLRKGCEYFQTAEPTSPVPFLVNRALRMAEMNFMDLLSEIAPDSVDRGRDILGIRRSDESEDNY